MVDQLFPALATRNVLKLFVGELDALKLGEREHILGSLARRDLLLLFGGQVFKVHNRPF